MVAAVADFDEIFNFLQGRPKCSSKEDITLCTTTESQYVSTSQQK